MREVTGSGREFAGAPTLVWSLVAVATTAAVAVIWVVSRGQDVNWDLHSYHYFSGYSLLFGRFYLDVMPTSIQTYLHPLPNLLAYSAFTYLSFPWSGLAILCVQLAAVPAVVLITRELARDVGFARTTVAEALAIALSLASPLWWSELGTSFYSSTTATFVLFGVWALVRAANVATNSKVPLRLLALAGLLLSVATALKLTNGVFLVAGTIATIATCISRGRHWLGGGVAFAAGGALGLLINAWWYAPVFAQYGNPVFPLYNALFRSPNFDFVNYIDKRWSFRGLADFGSFVASVWKPTTKTSEVAFADARISLMIVLAIVATCHGAFDLLRRRGPKAPSGGASSTLLWFFVPAAIVWGWLFAYQRYYIPLELMSGAVAWILLRRTGLDSKGVSAGLLACVLVSAVAIRIPDWGHHDAAPENRNPFGIEMPLALRETPAEYLIVSFPNGIVLPFLHRDSHFYRIDFHPSFFEDIRNRIARNPGRPIRLLTMTASQADALQRTARFGYVAAGECIPFNSFKESYVVCDLVPKTASLPAG